MPSTRKASVQTVQADDGWKNHNMWNLVTFPQDSRPKNWIYRLQSFEYGQAMMASSSHIRMIEEASQSQIIGASWDYSYRMTYIVVRVAFWLNMNTASREHLPVSEYSDLEPTAQKSWRLKKTFLVAIFSTGWVCQGRESWSDGDAMEKSV